MNPETNLNRLSLKASVRAGAMLLSLITAAAAVAAQPSDSRSQTVSLAGLDLSTTEGMSAARERVDKTARRLCSQVADPADLSHQTNYVKCVDDAVADAMLQVTGHARGLVAQSSAGQRNVR